LENGLKSGVCPKCNQGEIYSTSIDSQKILPDNLSRLLGWGNRPAVDNLVCGTCGYAEFYVAQDALDNLKKDWVRKGIRE